MWRKISPVLSSGLFGEEGKNPTPEDVRKFEALLKPHNPNVEIVIYPSRPRFFRGLSPELSGRSGEGWVDAVCGLGFIDITDVKDRVEC